MSAPRLVAARRDFQAVVMAVSGLYIATQSVTVTAIGTTAATAATCSGNLAAAPAPGIRSTVNAGRARGLHRMQRHSHWPRPRLAIAR
jgi:hypothetical protein